jgi:hypothetical protein
MTVLQLPEVSLLVESQHPNDQQACSINSVDIAKRGCKMVQ